MTTTRLHSIFSCIIKSVSAIPYSSILDHPPLNNCKALIARSAELHKISDIERLAGDWIKIGEDFRSAFARFDNERKAK